MKGRKQKILGNSCPQEDRAELEVNVGVQTFMWITETDCTKGYADIKWLHPLKLKNRRVPNGTHGGVRGRNGN